MTRDLDHKIIARVQADPDDPFVNLADIALKRSAITPGSIRRHPCRCRRAVAGKPVDCFSRSLFAVTRPALLSTVCTRCTEESYRFPQGVDLLALGAPATCTDAVFEVEICVRERLWGDALITLVFPTYLHGSIRLEPRFHRLAAGSEVAHFRVAVANDAIPQAYHYTAIALRDLSVSTYRKTFQVLPAGLHAAGLDSR